MILTKHSKERAKKRLGVSKSNTEKIAKEALKNGITHKEAKGNLSKYLNKIFLQYEKGNNMCVYHEKIFVFKGTLLITILQLPHNLCALANKLQKKKVGLV
jgi:hypothetical protein